MNAEQRFLNFIDRERNIYEPAQLFHQNRIPVQEYAADLVSTLESGAMLKLDGNKLVCSASGKEFPVNDEVPDFIGAIKVKGDKDFEEWDRLNTQFLNYHKSLSVYTLVNSTPVASYLGMRSGMAAIKDQTVVDIGAGTGHAYASFFYYPETLRYFLVDPNLRLLHDQFIRIYPKLSFLRMGHILAFAEHLPFRNNFADVVMSLSAIDHFKDYKAFFRESFRIARPGGKLFLSSHLDVPAQSTDQTGLSSKLFSASLPERIARYLYFKKAKVGHDDHTFHFTDTRAFEMAAEEAGFSVERSEIFKRYFYLLAVKPS
ncbi:MAG: hypothetical protein RLZZ46_1774 [Bacteroidota bacterium]|jgi:ubiquinone/menaquinone biosynthesis C-methylase UbiE